MKVSGPEIKTKTVQKVRSGRFKRIEENGPKKDTDGVIS